MEREKKIIVVTAGGSCFPPSDAREELPSPEEMLHNLPPLPGVALEILDWSRQPSSHYTIPMAVDLIELLRKCVRDGADGIVVAAGTDALEEMAYLADLLWIYPQPLVFTGALVEWGTIGSDAEINLFNAILAASSEQMWGNGVSVAFLDGIFAAREVTRISSYRRNAFGAPGMGPVAEILGRQLHLLRRPQRSTPFGDTISPARDIPILFASLGTGARFLSWLAEAEQTCDALVLAGFGLGNVPPPWVPHIKTFMRRNVPVVLTTRCHEGYVAPRDTFEGGAGRLVDLGVLRGGRLRPQQARLRLAVGLGARLSGDALQQYLLEE